MTVNHLVKFWIRGFQLAVVLYLLSLGIVLICLNTPTFDEKARVYSFMVPLLVLVGLIPIKLPGWFNSPPLFATLIGTAMTIVGVTYVLRDAGAGDVGWALFWGTLMAGGVGIILGSFLYTLPFGQKIAIKCANSCKCKCANSCKCNSTP